MKDSQIINFKQITQTLSETLNSFVEFENNGNFSTTSLVITIPTGATVQFEALFDGSTYLPVTFRGITSDGWFQKTSTSDTYIGSIICVKKFRVRVISAGSAPGLVTMRAQPGTAILEGIEHGNPPHKFGYIPVHTAYEFTTKQTDTILWTPVSGKKFIVTDFHIIGLGNTSGVITIFDETNSSTNWLFRGNIDPKLAPYIICSLKTPFVSSTINNSLKITTSSAVKFSVIIFGYETE